MVGRKILLVEGSDDEHVMKHICGNRDVPHLDEVKPHGSDNQLLESIPVRLKATSEYGDAVGVVIDADTSLAARWQSIRNLFIEVGYQNVSDAPDSDGTIFEPPEGSLLPKAGIWIMPDNQSPGILEDFLLDLIPSTDDLFDHVTNSVDSIPVRLFSENDEPKAVIHTWLAWQSEPGRPYGTAITAGFLDSGVPQVDVLVSWLRRLFYEHEGVA